MAVYTKINRTEIQIIENKFNIGKILSFSGIKKGIENTNYLIKTKRDKYILTIFEKRVDAKDLPFFMKLMYGLSKLKIKCPKPVKSINLKDHNIHKEFYSIDKTEYNKIITYKESNKNIYCVGTTALRAIETAYNTENLVGNTDLFIFFIGRF